MSYAEDMGYDCWDDYREGDYDYDFVSAPKKTRVPSDSWGLEDGTIVKIKDMTDSHLHNVIALLERRETGISRIARMQKELDSRPKLPNYFN